jgi:hypothetical protein
MERLRFMLAPMLGLALLAGCAAEVDGPTPQVTKITDESTKGSGTNVICKCAANTNCVNASSIYRLAIVGDGFAPLPVRLLEESPALELPTITLLHSGGETFVIDGTDASDDKLVYESAKLLVLNLPLAYVNKLPLGKYDVVVRNPNGNEGKLAGGLEVVLGPELESVAPTTACNTKET